MRTCEEMFLLIHDSSGFPTVATESGLRASVLADLADAGRVEAAGPSGTRLAIRSLVATGVPVLDALLQRLAPLNGQPIETALEGTSNLTQRTLIAETLVRAGVVGEERRRGDVVYPPAEGSQRQRTVDRLTAHLLDHGVPSARDATLLALIHAVNPSGDILVNHLRRPERKGAREYLKGLVDASPWARALRAVTSYDNSSASSWNVTEDSAITDVVRRKFGL